MRSFLPSTGIARHGDRLLTVVEVEKAADLLLGVEFDALLLELADAHHLLE